MFVRKIDFVYIFKKFLINKRIPPAAAGGVSFFLKAAEPS